MFLEGICITATSFMLFITVYNSSVMVSMYLRRIFVTTCKPREYYCYSLHVIVIKKNIYNIKKNPISI